MANTFELIYAASVGSGGAADITFNTIPSGYTDLCVKLSARSDEPTSNGQDVYVQFNNDTAANYSFRRLYGTGSSAASDAVTSNAKGARVGRATSSSSTASTFANNEFYIPNYTGSTAKSISIDGVEENNATASIMVLTAAIWTGTAAITSMKLYPFSAGTNFVQYTTAYLYGVKNA